MNSSPKMVEILREGEKEIAEGNFETVAIDGLELVAVFNSNVHNKGWSSMRAYHDQALIDEFNQRGVDVSAVSDGKSVSFGHHVSYDLENNKLVTLD